MVASAEAQTIRVQYFIILHLKPQKQQKHDMEDPWMDLYKDCDFVAIVLFNMAAAETTEQF